MPNRNRIGLNVARADALQTSPEGAKTGLEGVNTPSSKTRRYHVGSRYSPSVEAFARAGGDWGIGRLLKTGFKKLLTRSHGPCRVLAEKQIL